MRVIKAFVTVTAGVIPGESMPEHARRWDYLSEDYEADRQAKSLATSIYGKRMQEAYAYAMKLSRPNQVNWVRVDWIWV